LHEFEERFKAQKLLSEQNLEDYKMETAIKYEARINYYKTQTLRNTVDTTDDQIIVYEEQLQNANNELNTKKELIKSYETRIKELEIIIERHENDFNNEKGCLNHQIEKLKSENSKSETQLAAQHKLVEAYRSQNEILEKMVQKLTADITVLTEKIEKQKTLEDEIIKLNIKQKEEEQIENKLINTQRKNSINNKLKSKFEILEEQKHINDSLKENNIIEPLSNIIDNQQNKVINDEQNSPVQRIDIQKVKKGRAKLKKRTIIKKSELEGNENQENEEPNVDDYRPPKTKKRSSNEIDENFLEQPKHKKLKETGTNEVSFVQQGKTLARSLFSHAPLSPILALDNKNAFNTNVNQSNDSVVPKSNKRLFSAPKMPEVIDDDDNTENQQKGIMSAIPATPIARRLRSKVRH